MATSAATPTAPITSNGGPSLDDETDDLAALDALEKEAKEFDKDAEIDRILKAFQLDAYAVLDLQPGVGDSDIKKTYKKKSLLIHPDKTTNPSAPAAFDKLKKAQTELMDEKARAKLDEAIADARMLLMRERKLTVNSPEMSADGGRPTHELRDAWRRKTIEVLVDNEARRRRQLRAQMQEEGREQQRADEEAEARKRKRDHEQAWEQSRDSRIGSWRDFQKKAGSSSTSASANTSASGPSKTTGVGGEKKKKKLKVLG